MTLLWLNVDDELWGLICQLVAGVPGWSKRDIEGVTRFIIVGHEHDSDDDSDQREDEHRRHDRVRHLDFLSCGRFFGHEQYPK